MGSACKNCGKSFQKTRPGHIHCSAECRFKYSYKIRGYKTHICKKCGREYKSKNNVSTYCSRVCQFNKGKRVCVTCGNEYLAKRANQIYCNRGCNPYSTKSTDKFYLSKKWRSIRASFIKRYSSINGSIISNKYCIQCFKKDGTLVDMYAVDHIRRRLDGGSDSFDNLQSLCRHHHQSKSAQEGNKLRTWRGRNTNHYHTYKRGVGRYSSL